MQIYFFRMRESHLQLVFYIIMYICILKIVGECVYARTSPVSISGKCTIGRTLNAVIRLASQFK